MQTSPGREDRISLARSVGWMGMVRHALHRSTFYNVLNGFLWRASKRAGYKPDTTKWVPRVSRLEYRQHLRDMVRWALEPQATVIFTDACVPDAYRAELQDVTEKLGMPLVETLREFREAIRVIEGGSAYQEEKRRYAALYGDERLTQSSQLYMQLIDGCHPNALGHQLIAKAIADHIPGLR